MSRLLKLPDVKVVKSIAKSLEEYNVALMTFPPHVLQTVWLFNVTYMFVFAYIIYIYIYIYMYSL